MLSYYDCVTNTYTEAAYGEVTWNICACDVPSSPTLTVWVNNVANTPSSSTVNYIQPCGV
jgi:hypothetical protein